MYYRKGQKIRLLATFWPDCPRGSIGEVDSAGFFGYIRIVVNSRLLLVKPSEFRLIEDTDKV